MSESEKKLFIFAGSDEVGKKYFVNRFMEKDDKKGYFPEDAFLPVDLIKKQNKFRERKWDELTAVHKKWLLDRVVSRESFAFQTILCTCEEVNFIETANRLEYEIYTTYVVASVNAEIMQSMLDVIVLSDSVVIYEKNSRDEFEIVFLKTLLDREEVVFKDDFGEYKVIRKYVDHAYYKSIDWLRTYVVDRLERNRIAVPKRTSPKNEFCDDKPVSEPITPQESSMSAAGDQSVVINNPENVFLSGPHSTMNIHSPKQNELLDLVKMLMQLAPEHKVKDMPALLCELGQVHDVTHKSGLQEGLKRLKEFWDFAGNSASIGSFIYAIRDRIPEVFRFGASVFKGIFV